MSILNPYPGDLFIIIGIFFAVNLSLLQSYINYICNNFKSVFPPIAVAFIYKEIFYEI